MAKLTSRECSALARKIQKELQDSSCNLSFTEKDVINTLDKFLSKIKKDIEVLEKYKVHLPTSVITNMLYENYPEGSFNYYSYKPSTSDKFSLMIEYPLDILGKSYNYKFIGVTSRNKKPVPDERTLIDEIVIAQIENDNVDSIIKSIKEKYA